MKLKDYLSRKIRNYPSPLENLDYLFDGYAFTSEEIFGLFGQPQTGKTLLAFQTAYYLTSKGYNVLYIDTEGSLTGFARVWFPRLEERYGPLEDRDMEVKVLKSLPELLQYFGYKNPRIIVKGEKYEFHVDDVIRPAPVEEDIKRLRIDFLILDSITAPLRVFPTRQQNFPSRADAIASIMSQLLYLQGAYNIGILTTHHSSKNPTNPYDIWERVVGGQVLRYYIKRLVNIKPYNKQDPDVRKLWLLRGEGERMFGRVSVVKITKQGYIDLPKETWYRYLTDAELRQALNIEVPKKTSRRRK